ncbi:DMP19 family protein [bacterium]|nr:DMP19 family protein [bacterium]
MSKKVNSDWNLCQDTWQQIIDRYGENPSASDFTPREFVVVAVWTVSGIVGNGGFEYLFEGDLPGDTDYQLALMAFRTIGCEEAASTFEEAQSMSRETNATIICQRSLQQTFSMRQWNLCCIVAVKVEQIEYKVTNNDHRSPSLLQFSKAAYPFFNRNDFPIENEILRTLFTQTLNNFGIAVCER